MAVDARQIERWEGYCSACVSRMHPKCILFDVSVGYTPRVSSVCFLDATFILPSASFKSHTKNIVQKFESFAIYVQGGIGVALSPPF